ncbi:MULTISPECIES: ribosome maturation factor RimP [Clostridium]|jgi:ribosome maturation factor RimP|uniref:Ribosome maturation factor RimP n=2 Tax=Clostridium TaxID=1485 RepID=A0A151AR52_9CLOT|nr:MULTISPECIES: ribosome maturation factor RimP [Clostridium]MBE6079041.1 ribosome maturation factor RimP [Clostridium lundense]KYH29887.1 ribosome maturation factor RimP [Clostridium colicanis DSM 13634]MBE6042658.1 ribosome maturation factor RimP [Clostridium thermopalmarium]PRR75268.1 Ribosome maturation factor RimP [Clostridium thermopalmarium DSM 5974]PVZ28024.1 ribosome maturation factor RimP [Clostridium thermopalmarium DSM 5974]
MKNDTLINKLNDLIKPIVLKLNYELYYIEYIKENNENYLRVYIDNEKGISLEDCEIVSREISDMLDNEDPIEESYYLEVSSPGIERILYNDEHLHKYVNYDVLIKLSKPHKGQKLFEGKLIDFSKDTITIEAENFKVNIPREKIKKVTLKGEF